MKNSEQWRPSKFIEKNGRLYGSRDTIELALYSRLVADRVASFYTDAIRDHVHGRLIDLGCGKAPMYGYYKNYAESVVCVDWPNSAHGVQFVDHACDLARKLPFEDHSVESIILSDVLEHIATPELLWDEMRRILSPGGVILLNTPFLYWLHEEPFDFYRYTLHALRRFAEERGFEVVVLEPVGGSLEVIADIASKHVYHALPMIGYGLASMIQWMAGALSRSGLGKRIARTTSSKFPLGYAMVVRKPLLEN